MTDSTPTLNEYIKEAVAFFKSEYSLMGNVKGFQYEYFLSEVHALAGQELVYDKEYPLRREALEKLRKVGIVKEHTEQTNHAENGDWLYAICTIDEDKLTGATADQTASGRSPLLMLHLDKNGNLWYLNKEKFCYPMGASKKRLQILKYLIENKGLQKPDDIALALGYESKPVLRNEIGKIRDNIKHFLIFEGDEIIMSKTGSGYGINPQCKIIVEK